MIRRREPRHVHVLLPLPPHARPLPDQQRQRQARRYTQKDTDHRLRRGWRAADQRTHAGCSPRIRVPSRRPEVPVVGRHDARQRITVRYRLEISLHRGPLESVHVHDEWRGRRHVVRTRAVGAAHTDEGGVPEEGVVRHREVRGRGDGDAVGECAGELVVSHHSGGGDVPEVAVAEPGARADRYADPS
jgi:hypothetical protein